MEKGIIGDLGELVRKGQSFASKLAAVATYPITGNFSNTLKHRIGGKWPAFSVSNAQQASYLTNLAAYGVAAFVTYQNLPNFLVVNDGGTVFGFLIGIAFGGPALIETVARFDPAGKRLAEHDYSDYPGSLVGIVVSKPLEYAIDIVTGPHNGAKTNLPVHLI